MEEYLLFKVEGAEKRTDGLNFPPIVPDTHFSRASADAYELYIFGSYIGAIVLSQSAVEGILKFLCNKRKFNKRLISYACEQNLISETTAKMISDTRKYRNDFHHMNSSVDTDLNKLKKMARDCVHSLSALENELFGCDFKNGIAFPKKPEFWNISDGRKARVFNRSLLLGLF